MRPIAVPRDALYLDNYSILSSGPPLAAPCSPLGFESLEKGNFGFRETFENFSIEQTNKQTNGRTDSILV